MKIKILIPILVFLLAVAFVSSFSGNGTGSTGDPFQIINCTTLQEMEDNLTANYILIDNIDCIDTINWNAGAGFTPVNNFNAIFNGQEYEIRNLYINRTSTNNIGLFGENYGTITNIDLEEVNITGNTNVGGLVGKQNGGSITNSYTTGTIIGLDTVGGLVGLVDSGATINNSYSTANVKSNDQYVGGLFGETTTGTISNSYATGNVIAISNTAGGLGGAIHTGTKIEKCYATGSVLGDWEIGGLIADAFGGYISQSYSTGNVNGTGGAIGGLVGWFEGGATINNSYSTGIVTGDEGIGGLIGWVDFGNGNIYHSYTTGSTTGNTGVGGLIGYVDVGVYVENSYWDNETTGQTISEGGTPKSTADMQTQGTFIGWDFTTIWEMIDYPHLQWEGLDPPALIPPTPSESWPTYNYNNQRTGNNTNTPPTSIDILYESYSTGPVRSSPAIYGDYIYFGSDDDKVYQLNKTSLALVASYTTGGDVKSSPTVANGYVYVGSYDDKMYQLNASDISQLVASYTTGNDIVSSPAVANGYVYFGGYDDKVYQLDADNVSNFVASYTIGGDVVGSPAVANGYVYIGGMDSKVYQFDENNVSVLIASYTTNGYVHGAPTVTEDYLYVGGLSRYYQLNASDVSDYITFWNIGSTPEPGFSVIVDDEIIYVNGLQYIHARNASNIAQVLYSSSYLTSTLNGMSISDDYIFVSGRNPDAVYQLNKTTLALLGSYYPLPSDGRSSPIFVDGFLYAGHDLGISKLGPCLNNSDCALCEKCSFGYCINQNSSEDLKDECGSSSTCPNAYTTSTESGFCDGAGACDLTVADVSAGNVCIAGADTNPTVGVNCGVWSDCVVGETSVNEYYVGYVGDGTATCNDTDWQATGSTWNVSATVLTVLTPDLGDVYSISDLINITWNYSSYEVISTEHADNCSEGLVSSSLWDIYWLNDYIVYDDVLYDRGLVEINMTGGGTVPGRVDELKYWYREWIVNSSYSIPSNEPDHNVSATYEFETDVLGGYFNYSTYIETVDNELNFTIEQYNYSSASYVIIHQLVEVDGCQENSAAIQTGSDFVSASKMKFRITYYVIDSNPSGGFYGCAFGNVNCGGQTFCKPNYAFIDFYNYRVGGDELIVTGYNVSSENYSYLWDASALMSGNYSVSVVTNPSENSSEFIIDNIVAGAFDLPSADNYYEDFVVNWSAVSNGIGTSNYVVEVELPGYSYFTDPPQEEYLVSAWNSSDAGDNVFDGDFDTYSTSAGGQARAWINFSRPAGAVGAIVTMKTNVDTRNATLPANCFNDDVLLECWGYNLGGGAQQAGVHCHYPSWSASTEINLVQWSGSVNRVYECGVYWEMSNGTHWEQVDSTSSLSTVYDPDAELFDTRFRLSATDDYVTTPYIYSNDFNVSLEIIGYTCPVVTPVEASTVDFNVSFNVTVPQGGSAVTAVSANLTQAGNSYTSTGCTYQDINAQTREYTCTIPFQYFYDPGTYDIYVEASTAGATHSATQATYCTYNELTATQRDRNYVEFSSSLAGLNNVSVDVPVSIGNLGNSDITLAELTAYDISGVVVPSQKLYASYFRAGNSLSTSNQLENGVAKNISFTINNGENATLDFYLWVSAPADLYPQAYVATTPWSLVLS